MHVCVCVSYSDHKRRSILWAPGYSPCLYLLCVDQVCSCGLGKETVFQSFTTVYELQIYCVGQSVWLFATLH